MVSVGTGIGSGMPVQQFINVDQTATTANNALGTSQDNSMNQFTPGQLAVQGQAGNYIANILAGGSVPSNMGLPQAVYDAAFANFNKYQAPMLAAQHGAGSPAINASMQELQLQLAGMAGQQAMNNSLDAFSQAANFAFKPIGNIANKTNLATGNQTEVVHKDEVQTGVDWGGLLGGIFGLLPGGGFSLPPNPFGNV